jgi:two-component system cell cycle sensor histidine kinase/response regulator CckA
LPRGSKTILGVEDEDIVRSLITNTLTRAGYSVLQADRPSEALRICESHQERIDLMLADVVMPEMNGRELAERVVRMRRIGVVYMSRFTDAAIGTDGILPPDVQLIEKPFAEELLLETIRNYLDSATDHGTLDGPDAG